MVVRPLNDGHVREEEPGAFHHACGIPVTGAALIRPDGHLAWRTPHPPTDSQLQDVLRHVLATPNH